jgi:hypothetical protein
MPRVGDNRDNMSRAKFEHSALKWPSAFKQEFLGHAGEPSSLVKQPILDYAFELPYCVAGQH